MANEKQLGEELGSQKKTLQWDIIQRFMTPSEQETFWNSYRASRKAYRLKDRELGFVAPIPEQELEALRAYLNESDTPVNELADRFGTSRNRIYSILHRTAIRLCAQNKDKLGL